MNSMTRTILAVGAAGPQAGMVVPELAKRGATVRGLVRNAKEGAQVRANGAAEIAVGDLTDPASLDAALAGVDAVFYIAPAFMPNEGDVGVAVVAAAKRAGAGRFVFSSVIHPVITALANHGAKIPVEEALLKSGMEFTFLHPAMFFQNYAQAWDEIVKTGAVFEPWSGKTRFSRVDYRDVAEVAAIALTEDRLLFGTFELCAPGILDRYDTAAIVGEVLSRRIEAHEPDRTKPKPTGDAAASGLNIMADWYDKHALVGNPLILSAILGREPRTLRSYFAELSQASNVAA